MGIKKRPTKKAKKRAKAPQKDPVEIVEAALTNKEVIVLSKKTISEKIDQLVRSRVRSEVIETKLSLMGATIYGNEAKRKIAIDMLERYTGHHVDEFAKQIILTNFPYYVDRFKMLLPDAKVTQGSAFT